MAPEYSRHTPSSHEAIIIVSVRDGRMRLPPGI